jgi:hypothetical protein
MIAEYVSVRIVHVGPEVGVSRVHRGIHDLFQPHAALSKYRFQAAQSGSCLLTGRASASLVPDDTRDPHRVAVSRRERVVTSRLKYWLIGALCVGHCIINLSRRHERFLFVSAGCHMIATGFIGAPEAPTMRSGVAT